ncbi:DapH/DapD/GlmU-related protein [Streptococcus cameli]
MNYFHFDGNHHQIRINKSALLTVDSKVILGEYTSIKLLENAHLTIGHNVFFNDYCSITCRHQIRIGKDTMFGDGCRIFDHNHLYSAYHTDKNNYTSAPITIGKNCWFGANCVILKGVTIGDNVIVGAGSVVYQDIPSDSIVTAGQSLTIRPRKQAQYHAFTYTLSANIEHLAYLAEQLEAVEFHIAAPTNVSEHLMKFNKLKNVTIYPNISRQDQVIDFAEQCDIYLDINHLWESHHVLDEIKARQKPIFAFENVVKRAEITDKVIAQDRPEEMVQVVKDYLSLNQ